MAITLNGTSGITFPTGTLQATAAPGGGTNTTSAVDITLVNTSTQVQYISMTAVDKYVNLPNATTLGDVSPAYTIINNGQFPFHIRNNVGDILYYNLMSGETQTITLVDNATANGVWANNIGLLNLGGGLPQISSIAAINDSYRDPCVAMLSATQALIFYCPTSTQIRVVLATMSGTSVTYGTPVDVVASGGTSQYFMKAMAFNATTGILSYYNAPSSVPNWILRAVTVSGSTVTVGAITNLTGNNAQNTQASGYMAMMNTTTGVVGYVDNNPNSYIRAFTVSGTTITLGTAITLVSGTGGEFYGLTQLSSGKALFGYINASAYVFRVCTNSGTTLTLGTAFTVTTPSVLGVTLTNASYERLSTDLATGMAGEIYNGYGTVAIPVSGTTIGTTVARTGYKSVPNTLPTKIKYLSDGVQLSYNCYSSASAWLTLLKGNSSVGATAVSQFNLGVFVTTTVGAQNMFDVTGGNKAIAVGVNNGFLTSQVVGVL